MQNKTPYADNTRDDRHSGAIGQLVRLDELDDCKVAEGDPDIRGWKVRTSDGREAGKVDGLIVDTSAMQVRYLDVELDRKSLGLQEDHHVLVPIGGARLDESKDDVLLSTMTASQLAGMQKYQPGRAVASDNAPLQDTDVQQFYGKRGGSGQVQRGSLSQDEATLNRERVDIDRKEY